MEDSIAPRAWSWRGRTGDRMQQTQPMFITLARSLDLGPSRYRVLASPLEDEGKPSQRHDEQVATIDLNKQIELRGGEVHSIVHRGGFWSNNRALLRGAEPRPGEAAWAAYTHERTGLRWRHVLVVNGAEERRFLLRRRSWFGSPANADVVPLSEDTHTPPPEHPAVLLHAEKSGAWRRRIQARWLMPRELPLPVALFVLNVLVDLDRRAAAAASAGAAGV